MILEQAQRSEVGSLLTMAQRCMPTAIERDSSIDMDYRAEFAQPREKVLVFTADGVARIEPVDPIPVGSAEQRRVIRCRNTRPEDRFVSVRMDGETRRAGRRGLRRDQICKRIALADHFEIANREGTLRMRNERVVKKVESIGRHEIVIVLKRDELATRESSRVGAGVRDALVPLNVIPHAIAVAGHDCGGCVGGAVVQHDDFDRPIALSEHGIQRDRQHVRPVVATDDDRYERALQDAMLLDAIAGVGD